MTQEASKFNFDPARPPWDVNDRDLLVKTYRDGMSSPNMKDRLAAANIYLMSIGHMLHSFEVEDKQDRLDGGKPTDILGHTGDLRTEIAILIDRPDLLPVKKVIEAQAAPPSLPPKDKHDAPVESPDPAQHAQG